MNPFDLKATLRAKHEQHAVINPHTHGVVHGSNVWLANFNLLPSRVYARSGAITVLVAICYFFTTTRNISRGLAVCSYAGRSTSVLTNNSLINNLR